MLRTEKRTNHFQFSFQCQQNSVCHVFQLLLFPFGLYSTINHWYYWHTKDGHFHANHMPCHLWSFFLHFRTEQWSGWDAHGCCLYRAMSAANCKYTLSTARMHFVITTFLISNHLYRQFKFSIPEGICCQFSFTHQPHFLEWQWHTYLLCYEFHVTILTVRACVCVIVNRIIRFVCYLHYIINRCDLRFACFLPMHISHCWFSVYDCKVSVL